VTCQICGFDRRTALVKRDVCHGCQRKEQSQHCSRCGRKKHLVEGRPPLCPACRVLAARPVKECLGGCDREIVIFDQVKQFCERCHDNELQRMSKHVKQIKVACSTCGEEKSSVLVGRKICTECYTKERNGKAACSSCGKVKIIYIKKRQLCKRCYECLRVTDDLEKFLANYSTPLPHNKYYFDLLTEEIDWGQANEKLLARFRGFGEFLQSYQLPETLSWEAIEEAKPPLLATKRTKPKHVRTCLMDLGHMLAQTYGQD
jgi:hypothetical protein